MKFSLVTSTTLSPAAAATGGFSFCGGSEAVDMVYLLPFTWGVAGHLPRGARGAAEKYQIGGHYLRLLAACQMATCQTSNDGA